MTNEQKTKISELRHQGLTYSKIGELLGISGNTIRSFCRRNLLDSNAVAVCKQCGSSISVGKYKRERKFCSPRCCNIWWNAHLEEVNRKAYYPATCQHCGKEFMSYGNKTRKYCSRSCYITHRYGEVEARG